MLALKIIATVLLGLYILGSFGDATNAAYVNQQENGAVYHHPIAVIISVALVRITMLVVAIVAIWVA